MHPDKSSNPSILITLLAVNVSLALLIITESGLVEENQFKVDIAFDVPQR